MEPERRARERLAPEVYDFIAGGAGDEVTVAANQAAYTRSSLLPRMQHGGEVSLDGEILGCPSSMPVVLAPTAFHRLADPEGERATIRAAAEAGVIMIVSMAATVAIEELAPIHPAGTWFQLQIQPDLDFTHDLVARAEAVGCRALVVTVDAPVFGRRERDLRNGFTELPGGLNCENMRDAAGATRRIGFMADQSWDHIRWLRSLTRLPLVLKGIMHPADAVLAVEHGADAVYVSNHGGRQLDTIPPTAKLLQAVAAAVNVPVLVDGGVRRGTDVIKALALGADSVGIGRPVLWSLAGGDAGKVLLTLREDLRRCLSLCGCRSLADVTSDLLREPSWS